MAVFNVKLVKNMLPPEEVGVHYRLLCMTGKNKGSSYYLTGNRVIMGRGETADIQVMDTKSSREHAELILNNGRYIVTDLGSQNGLIINDLKITQHSLIDGDKIIIGATVYKFNRFDIQVKELALVEDDDDDEYEEEMDEEEEEEELRLLEEKKKKKKSKNKKKDAEAGRKRIMIIVVVALGLWVVLEEEPAPVKTKIQKVKDKSTTLTLQEAIRKQTQETREVQRKLDAIIHRGLREFRERNYFRAIRQFELALILSPNNGKASFHLERSKQRLDEEIELAFLKARREADGLKYTAAVVSYCSIIRLLQAHKDDERYKDAMKNIRTVEKEMGKFKDEIKCIQK
jgi:pSer/pThr/pTyr-binding forkhead associated (FHA) protein